MIITTNRVAVDRACLVGMPILFGLTTAGLTTDGWTTEEYTSVDRLPLGVAVSHR